MTQLLTRWFVRDYQNTKEPSVREAYGRMAGAVGIVCNALLSGGKLLVGWLIGSMSILADGLNNLSDMASSLVTLIGFKLSSRPADREHPFGHARYEYVSGLVVAFFILLVGFDLTKSSISRVFHPEEVAFGTASFVLLALSMAVKLWMFFFNSKLGRTVESATLTATARDSLNDVFTTGGVLCCALVSRFTRLHLDGYVGLAVAAFILISGVKMVNETLSPLLGEAPDQETVKALIAELRSYSGVLGVHDLMIHDYGPGRRFATVHVEMDAKNDIMVSHDLADQIERDFQKQGLSLVVHLDPVVTDDEEINGLRKQTARLLASLGLGLSMHDFRVVKGYSHTNLIFDAVLPYDCTLPDDEVIARIQRRIQQENETLFAVVQLDRSYIG
ncbi:MAG: cation transporter [Oscillospiraceae bacterium]|jgi:cation diffusion facilitator family transporter|nr:cation transporter [Oscillospiraceae bacterium]